MKIGKQLHNKPIRKIVILKKLKSREMKDEWGFNYRLTD